MEAAGSGLALLQAYKKRKRERNYKVSLQMELKVDTAFCSAQMLMEQSQPGRVTAVGHILPWASQSWLCSVVCAPQCKTPRTAGVLGTPGQLEYKALQLQKVSFRNNYRYFIGPRAAISYLRAFHHTRAFWGEDTVQQRAGKTDSSGRRASGDIPRQLPFY